MVAITPNSTVDGEAEKLTKTQKRILKFAGDRFDIGQRFRTKDIQDLLGCTGNTASKLVSDLHRLGKLDRSPSVGHAYAYQLADGVIPESGEQTQYIKTAELQRLLETWSKKAWEPKILDSYQNFPHVLARLFVLAHEVAYGSVIPKATLGELKKDLAQFSQNLMHTHKIVVAILDTVDLWEPSQFAAFLLKGGDPDELRDMAHKVKNIN